jgi:hypothetical protein
MLKILDLAIADANMLKLILAMCFDKLRSGINSGIIKRVLANNYVAAWKLLKMKPHPVGLRVLNELGVIGGISALTKGDVVYD